ncbi:MAG TPA: response regulator, partial [Fibrobacteria bacterium]|nr:response regulator [Fibrobacteria bacterium]
MFFLSEGVRKRAGKLANQRTLSYLLIAWPGLYLLLHGLNHEAEQPLHLALFMAATLILISGVLYYAIQNAREKKDLIAARDSAQSAVQEKHQLIATLGHDIRTPLNVIMGSAQLMEKPNSESENKEFLANIRTAATDLLGILNDVLDLSKIETGKAQLGSKPFQMLELVETVLASFHPQAEQKGLKLRLDADTEAFGTLRGDPCKLKHILHTLLSNVLKSTGSGTLVLSVRHAGGDRVRPRIRFEIADAGSRNTLEGREGSVQGFRQAGDCTTRNLRGSRLDLFLCKGLVELMGGSLIMSSRQGSGAMVVCTIPFDAITVTDSPSPEPDALKAKPLLNGLKAREGGAARILVVDDHPVNRMILQSMLQMHGFKADEVADGKQALDVIMVRPYDLILMDCHMPVMDGIECTRRIRALEGPRPIIIGITADTLPETRINCLQVGMDQVLLKPLQEQDLRTVLCPWKAAEKPKSQILPTPVVSEWLDVERLNCLIQSTRLSDPGHRKKALEQFESDVQDLRQALGEALDLGRSQQLKESAHGLKGLCLTLGLGRLADICKRIEGISGAQDSPDWSPVKSDFDTVCEASLAD